MSTGAVIAGKAEVTSIVWMPEPGSTKSIVFGTGGALPVGGRTGNTCTSARSV